MATTFCERWHRRDQAPIFPLSEDEARARHAAGELYTVVVGDHAAPKLLELNLREGYVGVRWLHPRGRDQLYYAFRRQGERLFLTEVVVSTIDAAGKVAESDSTLFKPDGTMQVTAFDHVNRTTRVGEPVPGRDVSMLWEDVPRFGDYTSISRRER